MSKQYRAMIYAAIATMHLYSKDIKLDKNMTVEEFAESNTDLIDRVFEEIKNVFDYPLSGEQIKRAAYAYMCGRLNPQSVNETEAYKLT